MAVTPDGSPVELYAELPERGEGELVAGAVASGASILELGAGAGRITQQLVARGLGVVAVDESREMLAYVRGAQVVCARIEGLDLRRRFDAVLLASNLFAVEEAEQRRAFLETCRRHADRTIVEMLPLAWEPQDGNVAQLGDVTSRLHVDQVDAGIVRGSMEYVLGDRTWTHSFAMRVFADEVDLDRALAEVGMRFDRWLDRGRGWFVSGVSR